MPGTYVATMARLGYTEQEISEVSDRLVADVVAYGGDAAIAAKVSEHLAAGADHVLLLSAAAGGTGSVDELEQLAPALAALGR
jgi:hypothetical protein